MLLGAATVLRQLGDQLIKQASDALRTLDQTEADQWKALALARFSILRALNRFIVFKEEAILLPLLSSSEREIRLQARRILDRNNDLQREYDTFIVGWSLASPLSVDASYKIEARAMMTWIIDQTTDDLIVLRILIELAP